MTPFILYEGPSEIDGAPIVCIVTDPNQARLNKKTQRVVQTYIFRQDIDPIGLFDELGRLGFVFGNRFGWVAKATFRGKPVDIFFPEHVSSPEDGASGAA